MTAAATPSGVGMLFIDTGGGDRGGLTLGYYALIPSGWLEH